MIPPMPASPAPLRRRRADTGGLVAAGVLVLGLGVFLFPIVWMAATSLKSPAETRQPLLLIPQRAQVENYPRALGQMNFANALANTIFVTTWCVLGQVLSCSLVGYGFAKFRFPGRGPLFILMLATMMLPAQVTMIPVFVLFRWLGLVDNLAALIIPSWFGSPFFIFLFRQFFAQTPDSVIEAARVDGASSWGIYWRILLPMSWPVVAVVTVYTFIWTWNEFQAPLIYINSPVKNTLALALAGFSGQYGSTEVHLLMAASVVTMLPCVAMFFAAQRYLISPELGSAVKG